MAAENAENSVGKHAATEARATEARATEPSVVVRNDVGTHRFVIEVDGEIAGYTAYEQFAAMRDFSHTEIDEAFAGRGLASILVRGALDQTLADGMKIEASCPVVQRFVANHPEYQT